MLISIVAILLVASPVQQRRDLFYQEIGLGKYAELLMPNQEIWRSSAQMTLVILTVTSVRLGSLFLTRCV